jgi:predicted NAD/FAD-binding protein
MWTFPARFLVEFFANHGMLGFAKRPQWKTIAGGSRRTCEALITAVGEPLRLSTPVARSRATTTT